MTSCIRRTSPPTEILFDVDQRKWQNALWSPAWWAMVDVHAGSMLVARCVMVGMSRPSSFCVLRIRCPENQIGIMFFFHQQIQFLSHLIRERKEIAILTADISQGRDCSYTVPS
ncbi:uncharacterized protein EDB91DRAFT_299327 [Suillus paluster]|uniref:uncharacterized protein n=1 Tax=Suillus paluster TaxID=48578 RepID=UPI001B87F682|nr:uncharacterized protein EDB91DRAFT_299327 [Suillus paluster]KAG1721262.1 hypothetical protein EDB91DRAFT_299327 [Suillus paluster]